MDDTEASEHAGLTQAPAANIIAGATVPPRSCCLDQLRKPRTASAIDGCSLYYAARTPTMNNICRIQSYTNRVRRYPIKRRRFVDAPELESVSISAANAYCSLPAAFISFYTRLSVAWDGRSSVHAPMPHTRTCRRTTARVWPTSADISRIPVIGVVTLI